MKLQFFYRSLEAMNVGLIESTWRFQECCVFESAFWNRGEWFRLDIRKRREFYSLSFDSFEMRNRNDGFTRGEFGLDEIWVEEKLLDSSYRQFTGFL